MSNAPIRAVAFDVDGTLYPNLPMYVRAVPLMLANLRFMHHFGAVRQELRATRPIEDFHALQAQLVAERLGISVEQAAARIGETVHSRWEALLDDIRPYNGAARLISKLKTRGVPLGVLSDFPVQTKLSRLGLDGFWDAAFSSEEIGYLKPNPEPFEELVRRLGVAPHQLLYVGNSYEYDVNGAKRAGLRAAHIARRAPAESRADFTFNRFSQLEQWIWGKLG